MQLWALVHTDQFACQSCAHPCLMHSASQVLHAVQDRLISYHAPNLLKQRLFTNEKLALREVK